MPRAKTNNIELEYETFGDPADPPMVLVMGLGSQLIGWPVPFCTLLATRGCYVVRYDHRDTGLSTYFDDLPTPDLNAILRGDHTTTPYTLSDLGTDITGLFDALGFARAHVLGISMGGAIVQQLAIDHPDRLLSLCSVMAASHYASGIQPTSPPGRPVKLAPSREEIIERQIATFRSVDSPAYPAGDAYFRERATTAYDRAYHPAGGLRHTAALLSSAARGEGLRSVTVPSLIIHGTDDPWVPLSAGKAVAAAIPGATMLTIPGMGHMLSPALWPKYVDAIARNACL
jgi:pimeloyl-ACP methyl ester carboxylesterase